MSGQGRVPDLGGMALIAAVGRQGSISAAARELGVAQQSASVRLRAVERQLGLELFRRSPAGVRPTVTGERVIAWAEEVLAAAERFRIGVEALREENRRELVVAGSQTVTAHLLPAWLVSLRERHVRAGRTPTAVRLLAGNSVEVADAVREGRADLGFLESSVPPDDLARSVVTHDALTLVVAPGHPWAEGPVLRLATVADEPLVMREEGSGTRRAWADAVRARLGREAVPPVAVLATSAAVRSAVAEGLGPAVLSRREVADDVRLGRLREVGIDTDPILRPITAVWRGTERDLSVAARELVEVAAAGRPGAALP